ncbi:shugoshin 2 [Eleutherodactylus coqui]|uniref:shugoshin 2 n=1 Tax=Eleutherodactylus coqui TaxID=57060 RepID=UPI0034619466
MMDFSSSSALQSVKERMREKLNGSLKAVKLQTSLAAKIKTKTLNNSSILKVSLKYNNKALACALTVEKEKSRRLGNDKMVLQKEVGVLQFKNALLRQNLKTVNEMLKAIDVCMKNNLPAAIDISNPMESSDRLSVIERTSDRFSQQSALSLDEDQGFRLTGQALRVPSSAVWQQKPNCQQPILVNEETTPLIVPPSSVTNVLCDKPEERKSHRLSLSSKEHPSVCGEYRSRDSFSSVKACDLILPLDEVFSPTNRLPQSGGFVTRRRKKSTGSHSNAVPKSSAASQSRSSTGVRRESSCTRWEMTTDLTLAELGHTEEKSYIDSVLQKDGQLSISHCPKRSQNLDTYLSSDVSRNISDISCKEAIPSTSLLQLNEGSDQHTIDGCVAQNRTVYEADMEMTSSESTSIIAVLPKNKRQASKKKSGIPVKETGTLRKVKRMGRESAKRTETSVDQQMNDSSNPNDKGDPAEKSTEKLISDRPYDGGTSILPRSVVQERLDGLESGAQSNFVVSALRESCGAGETVLIDTIELNGGKNKMAFNLQKDHCTEAGNIAGTAPKRRSKGIREMSRMESSREKKPKRHKNSINQGQVTEERSDQNDSSEQMDGSKKITAMLNVHTPNKQPKIRRETYVIGVTNRAPSSLISKLDGINYRRETFVIPDPDPLVSINLKTSAFEVRNDAFEEPQKDVNSLVRTDDSPKTDNRSDAEKEHCNAIFSLDDANAYKKHASRRSVKKAASNLFSQLDKRKTQILSIKQGDLRDERATLVRESCMNLTSNQRHKALKFPDFTGQKNESFMLDMVSESVLDNTMEFSSFAEFPSATNPEDARQPTIDVPAPELPVSEDCASHNNVLDENDGGLQQDTLDTGTGSNWQCKVEDQSMEIHEAAIKPLQDLTNRSFGSANRSPKSDSEEGSSRYTKRRRNAVSYKEPSLGKKLRRGDSHTNSEFLYSPPAKEKPKQKRKQNKVKSKKCKTEDV